MSLPIFCRQLCAAYQPLTGILQAGLFANLLFFFISKRLQTLLERLLLFVAQQQHAGGLGLNFLQLDAGLLMLFKDLCRNLAVNLGAGQLLQQLGALFRFRVQEGGELPLRQQHRAGEAAIVQAGERGGQFQLIFDLIGEDLAVLAARQLDARNLQVAVRLVSRPVLAPEGAVGDAFYLKLHFRQAFGSVAGHQIVLRLRHAAQARGFVIQRQTDSIQQGGFSGAGWPGNREQSVAGEGLSGEINFPFAFE